MNFDIPIWGAALLVVFGEVVTGVAKWSEDKDGLGWVILRSATKGLGRIIPTWSDLGKK